MFRLILLICGWHGSGHLPYNKQIASLRRFYLSRDWEEWSHLCGEQPIKRFIQVNFQFAYLPELIQLLILIKIICL